jgi:UDP-N-acetyl-D-glucosamine dehydrogenase
VTYSDPYVPSLHAHGCELSAAPESTAAEADCTVVLTDHADFDYAALASRARLIIDTRNALKGFPSPNVIRL